MAYQDGNFTNAIQDGPARVFYPFINAPTKDTTTKGTVRSYVVVPSSYTPAAALSTDPADNTQYLLTESEMTVEGGLGRYTRTYCKVPGDQVDYSSLVITKPAFPTNAYGSVWVDSTSSNTTANVFSAVIAATFTWYPTGGTFTITYKTSTTAAINTTASDATIAAAVNGLASVIADGFTVSASSTLTTTGVLTLSRASGTFNFMDSDFTWNTASITPAVNSSTNGGNGSNSAFLELTRSSPNVNKTSHGLSNAASIRITQSTGGGTAVTVNSIVDSDNFTFAWALTTITGATHYRTLVRTYTPGTDRALTKLIDKFYLPGVTPGISSGADIPVPDVAINDTQLLNLIAGSATGFQNYDAEPVTAWPTEPSPMFRQRFIQINVDNL
jgi:hypothetical protein